MKRIILFLLAFFVFGVLCAFQVTNLKATAISHDGFTARWDAIGGTESYKLEVSPGVEHSFGFDDSTNPPDGWSLNLAQIYSYPLSARSAPNFLLFNTLMGSASTPLLSNPGTLSFYARYSGSTISTRYCELLIQTSADGENWSNIDALYATPGAGSEITTNYQKFSYDLNIAGEHYIRLYAAQRNGLNIFVDDLQYTQLSSLAPVDVIITPNAACRVAGLSPQMDYLFRVSPVMAGAEDSAWKSLRTAVLDSSSGTGTAIADQAASITVSADNGNNYQSITILPASPGIFDYSMQTQLLESTFTFVITCENELALNGAYNIFHTGINVIGCTSSNGDITDYSSANGITAFSLSGIGGKASLTLYLETGETLPVQLSVFNVNYLGDTDCRITWLSQSESQLQGYFVLRSASSSLDDAEYISPLIPATNSSQPSSYTFTDTEAWLPAYYWLLASGYGGEEQYFGPVYQNKPESADSAQVPGLNRMRVFPNPGAERVSLQLKLEQMQLVDFAVYNSKGQLVESGSLGVCPKGDFQRILPTRQKLASGVYLIVLEGKDFQLKEKFVIQK